MLATANTGKIRRGFGKNAGKWTGRVEISKEEIPGSKRSMYGYILIYSRLKGRTHLPTAGNINWLKKHDLCYDDL